MKLKNFHEILENIPLEISLQVSNEMAFIALLADLGFIEDRCWNETESDNLLLSKICQKAREHTAHQLKIINDSPSLPINSSL